MSMSKFSLTVAALVALLFTSCTTHQQRGAGLGALGGGAIGALAGNDRRDVVRGAAIGAAVGTGVAALQEDQQRRSEDAYFRDQQRYDTRPQPEPPGTRPTDHPYAERTSNPGQVISPFPPYNVIDVSEFRSGQRAKDPSTGKIFRVP